MTSEARIEISTVCNYKCYFCPHRDLTRKKEIMSDELFSFILNKIKNQMPQINTITLSGMGESFFDKNILNKIKMCKGFKVNLLTNGSLLTKELVDEMQGIVDSIRISVHSVDRLQYKKITGSDSLEDVLKIINYTKGKIKLIITSDIAENTDIEKIKREFKDVELLEIWKVHNWAGWAEYRKGNRKKITCGRSKNGPLQIQVDGTVNMCCFDYDGELTFGDFKTQSLEEMFDSDMYRKIISFHSGNAEEILCSQCDQLYNDDPSIIIFNSKFSPVDRINMTSTNYENLQ